MEWQSTMICAMRVIITTEIKISKIIQEDFVKRVKFTIMKKVIMFLLLAVIAVGMSVLFTSCGGDDDESKIETYQCRLKVGETIDYYDAGNLVSEDEFVASANGTAIKGLHVGKTIVHSPNRIINLEVYSQYNMFDEPYIKFGGSKSDVKNYEKRTIQKETDTELYYKSTGSFEYGLVYAFASDGKLKTVVMMFNHKYDKTIASNLGKYFSDRYLPLSVSGYDSYFINNSKDKADVAIIVELFKSDYDGWGQITYMPYN